MVVDDRLRSSARAASLVPALTGGAGVLCQIAYPLVHGATRDELTIVIVLLYAITSLAHAAITRGASAFVGVVVVTVVFGFAVEVLGVHSGFPFGHYAYDGSLGARLFGVPLVIAGAWTMLAWPAALTARVLVRPFAARVVLGAWALATWDVFLDPQMVAAGHWRWADPSTHLPGVADVPLSNYAGWLLISALMSLALQWVLDGSTARAGASDLVPRVLYVWTWASSALGFAVFLHLLAAAAWGVVAMGSVAVPLAARLVRERAWGA